MSLELHCKLLEVVRSTVKAGVDDDIDGDVEEPKATHIDEDVDDGIGDNFVEVTALPWLHAENEMDEERARCER